MTVFGDVNVSVYGNSDVLKLTFTFKCVLLGNQTCNYSNHFFSYIAALYLLFIPVSFIKFNPLSLSWYFLQNSKKVLFQVATSQSGKQLRVPRLYIILIGISNSQHAKVCAAKISLRPIIILSVRPSFHEVYCNENRFM